MDIEGQRYTENLIRPGIRKFHKIPRTGKLMFPTQVGKTCLSVILHALV